MNSLRGTWSLAQNRDTSISTAMSMLQLDGEVKPNEPQEYQANSARMRPPPERNPSHKSFISNGPQRMRIDSVEAALVLFELPGDSLVAPKTPSHIPVLSKTETLTEPPITPRRTPKPSPQKTPYLTKDSNIPGFTAWDVDGRLENVEGMFRDIKNSFSGTAMERNVLEEALAVYKTRGKILYVKQTARC